MRPLLGLVLRYSRCTDARILLIEARLLLALQLRPRPLIHHLPGDLADRPDRVADERPALAARVAGVHGHLFEDLGDAHRLPPARFDPVPFTSLSRDQ